MADALVIGIGNVARGDDGVAHRVVDLLAQAEPAPAARLVTSPDLDVAMAADVAEARIVIVIDAERRDAPSVVVSTVEPGTSAHSGHAIDPAGLLAVAAALYGDAPPMLLVSVAAPEMDHGEALSRVAKAASVEAAFAVAELLRDR